MSEKITSRKEDYSKWYLDVIKVSDLAENAEVKGCMVIKPYGFALWEKIKDELDRRFKETGHQNAYFPLLVPKNYLKPKKKCGRICKRMCNCYASPFKK